MTLRNGVGGKPQAQWSAYVRRMNGAPRLPENTLTGELSLRLSVSLRCRSQPGSTLWRMENETTKSGGSHLRFVAASTRRSTKRLTARPDLSEHIVELLVLSSHGRVPEFYVNTRVAVASNKHNQAVEKKEFERRLGCVFRAKDGWISPSHQCEVHERKGTLDKCPITLDCLFTFFVGKAVDL